MLRKIVAGLLGTAVLVSLITSATPAADFQKLPLVNVPTSVTVTEDGQLLLVAHDTEDCFSVVDVKTAKVLRTVETPRPTSILSRGDKVLVANHGKGTISIFSQSNDWQLADELEVGEATVWDLTAPQGPHFKGNLLATCKTGRDSRLLIGGNIDREAFKEVSRSVYMSIATISFDGRYYFTQGCMGHSPSAAIGGAHDFQALVRGQKTESLGRGWGNMPFIYQVSKGPYWFGGTQLCKGMPPAPMGESLGRIVVPDRKRNVCYALTHESIKCIGLDAALTDLGQQPATFPEEYARMRKEPPWQSAYDHGSIDRYQVAVTLDDALYIYLYSSGQKSIFYCKTEAFDVSAAVAAMPTGPGPSVAGESGESGDEFPSKILVGKKVAYQVPKRNENVKLELIRGPEGAKLSAAGVVTWTPTKDDVGAQQLKIRVQDDRAISFLRLKTEVVDLTDLPPVATQPGQPAEPSQPVDLENAGLHELVDNQLFLAHGLGGTSILFLNGNRFRVLDKSGLTVARDHDLDTRYRQMFERPEYYVALAPKSVELLDKKTLAVKKSIPIDYSQVTSLAINPARKVSYVAVANPSEKNFVKSKPVLEVDESTGEVKGLPGVFGNWLAVDPAGRQLFTGVKDMYRDGIRYDTISGRFLDDFSHIDIVIAYGLGGGLPRENSRNENPGANGSKLRIAPDGKHVSYVAGGGAPGYGYSIAALAAGDVGRESSRYQIEAYPRDVTYHPMANLVACTNGNEIWIFNRHTGEKVSGRLDSTRKFKGIAQIFFAAGGTRLMIAHNHPQRGNVLEAVALTLTAEDRAAIAKGFPAVQPAASPPSGTEKWPKLIVDIVVQPDASPPSDPTTTPNSVERNVRTWTDSTGKFQVKALLVGVKDGKVALKRATGQTIAVPLDRLSEEDQEVVRRWLAEQ